MRPLTKPPKKLTGRTLILIVLLLAGLLIVIGGAFFFPYWMPTAIAYAPNFGRPVDSFHETTATQLAAWGINQQIQVPVGPPSARLSAWVMEPNRPSARGSVLVLHGIRDSKASMRGIGRLLAEGGYRAVLVDLRGHGSSSGDWLTYGIQDSQDLTQLLDVINGQNLLTRPAGVFGCSYGAATAIQLAARDPRIKSAVAVAPFATLHGAIHSYARLLGLGFVLPKGMIDRAVQDAGRLGHFEPAGASTLQAIRQTSARVLLIHGTSDWKIPPSSSQQLHAAAPHRSRLVLVENAGHDSVMATLQQRSKSEILAWFDQPD